jgi:hypothetical protein
VRNADSFALATRRTAPPAAGRQKWLCHFQALAFSEARERRDCV